MILLRKRESERVANRVAAASIAVVLIVILAIVGLVYSFKWISSYDPIKAEETRLQVEYEAKFVSLVSGYSKRVQYGYKMRPGDGVDNALQASGVLKELGSRDSMRYQACREAVNKMNRFDSDWPGHTMYVPLGKTGVATASAK